MTDGETLFYGGAVRRRMVVLDDLIGELTWLELRATETHGVRAWWCRRRAARIRRTVTALISRVDRSAVDLKDRPGPGAPRLDPRLRLRRCHPRRAVCHAAE